MKEIKIGTEFSSDVLVENSNLAVTVGSGSLEVFATPMAIALVEKAACGCLKSFLDDGETTVGTDISFSHTAPTPLGARVSAKVTVSAVEGREITFSVEVSDNVGLIGIGTHKRFLVFAEKFQQKVNAKINV
ncbi:MAG: thioesterase family protein [Oscillospiraceae bacterium]